jgi:hypothetical protein
LILKFIKYLLFILTSIFILVYGLHLVIDHGLKKQQNDFFSTMNHILNSSEKHQIMVFGASLSKNGLSTLVIDSVKKVNSYNAGMYGFGLVETNMLLKCYLKSAHPKPEIVLFSMPENLFPRKIEIGYPCQYYPYLDNTIVSSTIKSYDSNISLLQRFPFLTVMKYDDHIKYVALIPYLKSNHAKSNAFKGYDALEGTIKASQESSRKAADKNKRLIIDRKQLAYFYDFCNLNYKNDIRLVVLFTPKYKNVLNPSENALAIFLKSKQDSLHFKLIDFSNDSTCLDPDLFYDRLHLNSKGAKVFTAKICERI